jgi:hypothetical protein
VQLGNWTTAYDSATVGLEDATASPNASFVNLMCSPNCTEGERTNSNGTSAYITATSNYGNWMSYQDATHNTHGYGYGFTVDSSPQPTWTSIWNGFLGYNPAVNPPVNPPVGHCGKCHSSLSGAYPQNGALDGMSPSVMYTQIVGAGANGINDVNDGMCNGLNICPTCQNVNACGSYGGSCSPYNPISPSAINLFQTKNNPYDPTGATQLMTIINPYDNSNTSPIFWMLEPQDLAMTAYMPYDVLSCNGNTTTFTPPCDGTTSPANPPVPAGTMPLSCQYNYAKSRIKRWVLAGALDN